MRSSQLPLHIEVQLKAPKRSAPRAVVIKGDAFDLLPKLAPESVDLVITRPPGWGSRTGVLDGNSAILRKWAEEIGDEAIPSYDWYRKQGGALGCEPLADWYVHHLAEILDLTRPCLKPLGSMWVNLGDTYYARCSRARKNGRRAAVAGFRQERQLLMVPARFAIAMQQRRWIVRNDLIWFKPNVAPRPEADRLRLSHEHFFHFVKRPKQGRARYHYDLRAVEAGAADVVTLEAPAGDQAAFPETLIRPRILGSSPSGGTVVDPFCGSGSALTVAVACGRRAIGFDRSLD